MENWNDGTMEQRRNARIVERCKSNGILENRNKGRQKQDKIEGYFLGIKAILPTALGLFALEGFYKFQQSILNPVRKLPDNFPCKGIKRNSIFPNSQPFKTPIDILPFHAQFAMECLRSHVGPLFRGYSLFPIPIFPYSSIPASAPKVLKPSPPKQPASRQSHHHPIHRIIIRIDIIIPISVGIVQSKGEPPMEIPYQTTISPPCL